MQKKRNLQNEDELEDGIDKLALVCAKKFNNLKKSNSKKRITKQQKNNDKETQFMALLIQLISTLSNAYAMKDRSNKTRSNCNKNSTSAGLFNKVEPHCLTIKKFSQALHQCPYHNENKGMHAMHKPEDHAEWNQRQKKGSNKKDEVGDSKSKAQQPTQKLELSDAIKVALTTGYLLALIVFLQDQLKEQDQK